MVVYYKRQHILQHAQEMYCHKICYTEISAGNWFLQTFFQAADH